MIYKVLCIAEEGSYIEEFENSAKVGDYIFNYEANTLQVFKQTGSSVFEFVNERDENYIRLFRESYDFQKWEGKDHRANEILYIEIDYPKKDNTSGSTDEPEGYTKVHAHINSLKPNKVVVGDDSKDEIYSITDTIGSEFTPIYVRNGILTAARDFRRSVDRVKVSQNNSTATVQLFNPDSTTTDFNILPVNFNRAGLMTPSILNNITAISNKVDTLNSTLDTSIIQINNDVDNKLSKIPTKDQVTVWARTAAENALTSGFAAKWSAIARQIQLDNNGNIVAINGAGFLVDDSLSEMFSGYMDANGKQKFASIITDVYNDELKGIESRIKASADKIYLRAYKEAALGVFDENKDTLVSGLIANEDFMSLVYKNTGSGTSGSITINEVLNYNISGKPVSQILLDANQITTSENVQVLNLLTTNYNNGTLDLSGFIASDSFAGTFVSKSDYSSDKTSLQSQINNVSGIFVREDNDGKSTIFLDADDIRFRQGATVGTYLGTLATYENGQISLNPAQLKSTSSINAILDNEISLDGSSKKLLAHLTGFRKSINNLENGITETVVSIDADRVIIGAGADNYDPSEKGKLSDVLEINNGEIVCKAATFTEGQKTIFKNVYNMETKRLSFVGMPIIDEDTSSKSGTGYCTQSIIPYWYGEDNISLIPDIGNRVDKEFEEVNFVYVKSVDTPLYKAKDMWDAYHDYYLNNTRSAGQIAVRWDSYKYYNYNASISQNDLDKLAVSYDDYYKIRCNNMATPVEDWSNPGLPTSTIKQLTDDYLQSAEFHVLSSTNVVITGKNVILPCSKDWVGRKVILTSLLSNASSGFNTSYITTDNRASEIYNVSAFSNTFNAEGCGSASMIGVYEGMIELCYLPKTTEISDNFYASEYCWFITSWAGKRFSVYNGKILEI